MKKTVFEIKKMDCPSEENLIRLKLSDFADVVKLDFDIPKRSLTIVHKQSIEPIEKAIASLQLGHKRKKTIDIEEEETYVSEQKNQRKLLWIVLAINFSFFLLEMTTGVISKSMGLVADSLDMLADSFVYGLSLFAVGGTVLLKKRIAKIAGYFQILLAILGLVEVFRRFFESDGVPNFSTMIIVSILALLGNAICLLLLQKSKNKNEAHMQASLIFTSNDVIINLGVLLAGLLVYWLNSKLPDLIVGSIVFILVMQGAVRILKLSK